MSNHTSFWNWDGDTLILRCLIQPKAQRDEIVGEHDGRLRIRINALPADGAANKRLCKYLATTFRVGTSDVDILSGEASRLKTAAVRKPRQLPDHLAINPAGEPT